MPIVIDVLGAPYEPLWLKNSHDKAIFSHFLTLLAAVIPFMHKTCTERTKTFLVHRTIDEATFFASNRHLSIQAYRAPKIATFLANSRPNGTGWLQARSVHLEGAWQGCIFLRLLVYWYL